MARIRTIKPEFWESETVAELSLQARLTFIACLNLADDEGRLRWNAAHVKAFAFPYDDEIFTESVSEWLSELVTARLIEPYTACSGNGSKRVRYAFIVGFKEHQRVNRPTPSKYPPPPAQNVEKSKVLGNENGLTESLSEDSVSGSLLEGKGREWSNAANELPRDDSCTSGRQSYPDEFEQWWAAYPANAKGRKRGKKKCYGLWRRVPADDRPDCLTAAKNYASEETEFVKDPERFLASDFWRDYVEAKQPESRLSDIDEPWSPIG